MNNANNDDNGVPRPVDPLHQRVLDVMEQQNAQTLRPFTTTMKYLYTRSEENIALPGTETADCSAVYRSFLADEVQQKFFVDGWYHAPNFVQTFAELCRERRGRTALAYRPVAYVNMREQVEGYSAPMAVTYFRPTKKLTYDRMWYHVENFGKGLLALGEKKGNTVCVFLDTRWEWLVSAFGVWTQQMVLGTVYANLGDNALAKAFKETGCETVITMRNNVSRFVRMIRCGDMQRVRLIVLDGPTVIPIPPEELETVDVGNIEVIEWEDVIELGRQSVAPVDLPTDNDALALIMYTSGTTGEPKGVMHSYGALSCGVKGFERALTNLVGPPQPDDVYLSTLPLAHIFEFSTTCLFMMRGNVIAFASARSLLDTFARPRGDLREFRPFCFVSVPRVFDTIKKTIENSLPARGTLERAIFDHAFETRLRCMREGLDTPFWNENVFTYFHESMGGRIRCLVSGGGPLSAATQTFMNVVVSNCVQGWGLSETCSLGCVQNLGDLDTDCVGMCELSCEIKLKDTNNYKHTDKPEPRGEICIRGPFLFKGYYKKPEWNAEALRSDGWFHTGDIGAITTRGRLRLIGRVKAIAKNVLGEYIPLEALESLYAGHPLSVPNGVCVLVQPTKSYITALVCTEEEKVAAFLRQQGLGYRSEIIPYPTILEDPELQSLFDQSFRQFAKEAGRGTQEIVRHVRLLPHAWSAENDLLTSVGKLRRSDIETRYKDVIAALFAEER